MEGKDKIKWESGKACLLKLRSGEVLCTEKDVGPESDSVTTGVKRKYYSDEFLSAYLCRAG